MTVELLLREFDGITEAPGAIARLRRFALDLAVRGLLNTQDDRDANASSLIDTIVKSPRDSRLRAAYEDIAAAPVTEPPFRIPPLWAWTRLGRVSDHIQRGKSPTYSPDDGPLVVSQKCVRWEGLDLSQARSITPSSLRTYESQHFLRNEDLLWNSTGTGTIGRVTRVQNCPADLVCDGHVTVVRCSRLVAEYVRLWLRSDHVYGRIEADASGATNQVELTLQMALAMPLPLPPLPEQHRIVAKVEELMTQFDGIEGTLDVRENARDATADTALNLLTAAARDQSSGAEALRERAVFYLDNSHRLVTRPEHLVLQRPLVFDRVYSSGTDRFFTTLQPCGPGRGYARDRRRS